MILKGNRLFSRLTIIVLVLTGCGGGGLPVHLLRLTPESLQNRALQTKTYEGISESDLFSAATGVIQDLGFMIDESEPDLGLIVSSKKRDAEPGLVQRVQQVIGAATGNPDVPVDDYQKLWASICLRPASEDNDNTHDVRVTFQRIVWNTDGEIDRLQSLDEPEFYQKFFDLLSKSAFLEGRNK